MNFEVNHNRLKFQFVYLFKVIIDICVSIFAEFSFKEK